MISRFLIALAVRLMMAALLLCGLALVSGYVMTRSGVIAYSSLQNEDVDIHLMEVNRRLSVNVTRTPGHDEFSPTWSPDGQELAFVGWDSGNYDLYVMDSNGKNPRRLTDHYAYDLSPSWSPDGQRLAFISDRAGNFEIYVTDLTCNGGRGRCGDNPLRLTTNQVYEDTPVWSPNGTQMVFESDRDGSREIYVMSADGGEARQLTTNVAVFNFSPMWSPNGRLIAFVSDRDGDFEIYVMDADGSSQRQLTHNNVSDSMPNWSPDGERIVFTSNRDTPLTGNSEIYVMNADGSSVERLTWGSTNNMFPRWRPQES